MVPASHHPSAPVVARSRAPAACFGDLPPELVPAILEFLDQDDLRQAASVSRALYGLAWRAGLHIHRQFRLNRRPGGAQQLETLADVVRHALQKGLRLSLSLAFMREGTAQTESNLPSASPTASELSSWLTAALPVVRHLSLSVANRFLSRLGPALGHPAPNLQKLVLATHWNDDMSAYSFPEDILAGDAPQLRHLELHYFPWPSHPVPAFSRAVSIHLKYKGNFPDIDFASDFPRIRVLRLSLLTGSRHEAPVSFKLDGLRLRKLAIDDDANSALIHAILCSINVGDTPNFEYICGDLPWEEPLWRRKDIGPLSIGLRHYVTADSDISVLVVPVHRRWRRTFHPCNWNLEDHCPIVALPYLGERLTYLRMNNLYLFSVLGSAWPTLTALRELQLDFHDNSMCARMVWPPDWEHEIEDGLFIPEHKSAPSFANESYSYISCPGLEKLRLFALDAGLSVASQEVAFLGRALSQCARNQEDRAALELLGVELNKPVACALLTQVFSAVREYEFTGRDSAADREEGLWEDEFQLTDWTADI